MQPFFNKIPSFLFCFIFSSLNISAQTPVGLPTCSGYDSTLLYYISGNQIYNYDPALPISATNPWPNSISGAAAGDGLALGRNIYSTSPAITFYTCGSTSNNYFWYNGTTWVNSGFNPGNNTVVNPGSSKNFIYNFVGSNGEVYVNNSSGNGSLLTTVTNFNGGGPFDIQGDDSDNFYIIKTSTPPEWMHKYNSSGILVDSFTLSGVGIHNMGGGGGGFVIIGNNVFLESNINPKYWHGTIIGSDILFTSITGTLTPEPQDFAGCPMASVRAVYTGVKNVSTANDDLQLYPNPSHCEINIQLPENSTENWLIAITDVSGRFINSDTYTPTNNIVHLKLDLPSGTYFVHASCLANHQSFIKKLVLQR